jgi:hypothetical protein
MKSLVVVFCLLAAVSIAVADSLNIRLIGQSAKPYEAWGVTLRDSYAYVAAGPGGGLSIISVADPAKPYEIATCPLPGNAIELAVSGDYVYVASQDSGLYAVSVADPGDPVEVGRCVTPGLTYRVVVDGDYAYVADRDSGLTVVSIANPESMYVVANHQIPSSTWDVERIGDYAFCACQGAGLRVISVANPESLYEVASCSLPGSPLCATVRGDYAYVGDWSDELCILSVADPEHPALLGLCAARGPVLCVALQGDTAYVAAGNGGLRVMDVSDPTDPFEVGYYATPTLWPVWGVDLDGEYIYIGDEQRGFQVFEFYHAGVDEEPRAIVRVLDTPTIVRRVLRIEDRGPVTGDRAALMDVSGRKAMNLHAGANDVRHLAPGVYFVRDEGQRTRDVGRTRKVVVTR